ncbi:MAG TPA: hypothetical protein VMW24_13480 [Sedimentisphaerales bacterium]|nr:hypothetical protein [Sedimentisphaerales bacterium]
MTETHGTDVNETISVKGLDFSAQLTIGAAKWLERATGMSIVQFGKELASLEGATFDVTRVSQVMTALYIANHPGIDPNEAEAAVDSLGFPDMMEVLGRARVWEFEPKNSPPASPTEAPTEESTGPSSSTT